MHHVLPRFPSDCSYWWCLACSCGSQLGYIGKQKEQREMKQDLIGYCGSGAEKLKGRRNMTWTKDSWWGGEIIEKCKIRGGFGRWTRGIEHRQKSTLFELACPADNLSWFPCRFSLHILWSEHLRSNKVDFEAQKATSLAAKRLCIFYKSSQTFSPCWILSNAHSLTCLFPLCLSLETGL